MKQKLEPISNVPKALFTLRQVSEATNTGLTKLYADIARGKLAVVKNGRNTRATPEAVRRYVGQMPPLKPRGTSGSEA